MSYFASTRNGARVSFRDALFEGLAPDGGLYIPTETRSLGPPPDGATRSFLASTLWAAEALVPGLPEAEKESALRSAFDFQVPLIEIGSDLYVLELFHGPTHSFKDVGARFMARIMGALRTDREHLTILVATSGDTGGAVADAFAGIQGFRVAVLFPRSGVSERQRRQMTTIGRNVVALGVEGSFDDCQRLAKCAMSDGQARERFGLTSANSINIGRLLPQSLYYAYAAAVLGWASAPARFAVPSGNLGNLCAGLLAHRAGMPARNFLAATNRNTAFADFLASGDFRARPSIPTCSSAMDVGDPSNLERIEWIYRASGGRLRSDVTAVTVTDAATVECISSTYAQTGYVLDPHTAVAYSASQRAPQDSAGPTVILATAHPAKFPEVVHSAIGREVPMPEALAARMQAEEHMTTIPPELDALTNVLALWEPR